MTDAAVQVGTYTLTESGPPGYTASAWVCGGAATSTASTVTLAEGESATCTITNTAVVPELTLVKVVDNGTTGGTAIATDWTLTASGPTTIAGVTGDLAITAAAVPVGTYVLSEADGPAGYAASPWTCVGGTPGTDQVVLAAGERATCSITNTAIAPTLTLVKVVENGTTGATATPADWVLTADGPVLVSGRSGDWEHHCGTCPGRRLRPLGSRGPPGYAPSDWLCIGAPVIERHGQHRTRSGCDLHDHRTLRWHPPSRS